MKIHQKNKLSILIICISLMLGSSLTAFAAEEANVSNNTITAAGDIVGASAGNGDNNTAIGVAGVIGSNIVFGDLIPIDEYNNGHAGVSSRAEGGTGNRAYGYGAWAVGTQNTALGASSQAVGLDNTAIGYGSTAYGGGSVALGAGSVADRPNTVSVGNSSGYGQQFERQITNVAPGYYATDAVNMSQLWGVDAKVNRVGAMAFAMSALAPLPYDPKDPTQYSAGIGTYNGQGAVAFGIYHYTKPTVMLNAAVAMSGDNWEKSARMGITWRTGGPKPKALLPASAVKEETVTPADGITERVAHILAE